MSLATLRCVSVKYWTSPFSVALCGRSLHSCLTSSCTHLFAQRRLVYITMKSSDWNEFIKRISSRLPLTSCNSVCSCFGSHSHTAALCLRCCALCFLYFYRVGLFSALFIFFRPCFMSIWSLFAWSTWCRCFLCLHTYIFIKPGKEHILFYCILFFVTCETSWNVQDVSPKSEINTVPSLHT